MAKLVSLEVVNFREEMRRIDKEVTQLANQSIEERVDYATDQLRIVTPVDTGEARSGWENEKYIRPDGFQGAAIKNDVEHISVLNKGHSKQAPRYFIEQVLIRIGILTPK